MSKGVPMVFVMTGYEYRYQLMCNVTILGSSNIEQLTSENELGAPAINRTNVP